MAGLVLLVVMVSATACDSVDEHKPAPAPSSTPTWPAVNVYEVPDQIRDATMVWSAEPGIDLFSDEGVVTRAAEESALIGLMAGLDYAYIGFASSSDSTVGPVLGDFEADTGRGPFAGTVHGHIQQIIPTETGFDAVLCVLSVGLDVLVDGKYSPSRIANGEGSELRTRFIRTGETVEAPARPPLPSTANPDDLHWQAPIGNEFRGWKIDGFTDRDPITSGNGRCTQWARSLYPDTTPVIPRDAYANEDPPPVQPAYPGWPDGSN